MFEGLSSGVGGTRFSCLKQTSKQKVTGESQPFLPLHTRFFLTLPEVKLSEPSAGVAAPCAAEPRFHPALMLWCPDTRGLCWREGSRSCSHAPAARASCPKKQAACPNEQRLVQSHRDDAQTTCAGLGRIHLFAVKPC